MFRQCLKTRYTRLIFNEKYQARSISTSQVRNHESLLRKLVGQPHVHNHNHSHNALENVTAKGAFKDQGQRITIIGFLSNVFLTGAKTIAGSQFNSQALLADAAHSASDVLSDIVTLFTIQISSKGQSLRFPKGRQKLDALGSLAVSGFLISASIHIAKESTSAIYHLYQHAGAELSASLAAPGALYIAAGTILIKELLYHATLKEARRTGNNVLVASAWHHRSDSLSTAAAVLGIAGSIYLHIPWLDPAVGLLVSALLLRAASRNVIMPIQTLVDYSPETPKAVTDLVDSALQTEAGSQKDHFSAKTSIGVQSAALVANVTLYCPNTMTLAEAETLRQKIYDHLKSNSQDSRYTYTVDIQSENTQ